MSLVDPSTRCWNRRGIRRAIMWICWGAALIATLTGGWATGISISAPHVADQVPGWVWAIAYAGGLVLLLLGELFYFLSTDSEEFNPRAVSTTLAVCFVALGVGQILAQTTAGDSPGFIGVLFAVAGIVAVVIIEWRIRVQDRRRRLQREVEHAGTSAIGTITKTRGYFVDHSPVTRVTVRYADSTGQTRWVSQSVGGTLRKGTRMRVRYSATEPGRKEGITVEPLH